MPESSVTTIACDESAAEGENLMASRHPVFVHGSVNLSTDDATALYDNFRAATGSRAQELKSKTALLPRNRGALLETMAHLKGAANIYFVEKSFFVTAKMISLFIALPALDHGHDLAASGEGRDLADKLHGAGPAALGEERWATLLHTCNALLRSYTRAGAIPPSVQPFFDALDEARTHCTDFEVRMILEMIWSARHIAFEYEGASRVELRELDPMAGSLTSVSMTWAMRLNGAPFEFLIDEYRMLTEDIREAIVAAAQADLTIRDSPLPRGDLRAVHMIDSTKDVRIRVADIVAGAGREVARTAMDGVYDDELLDVTYQMLDFNPMCSTGSALDRLTELRPLTYLPEWMRYPRVP